jgi:hypothetical protein
MKRRKIIVEHKWLIFNKNVAYKIIIDCTNTVEIRNTEKYWTKIIKIRKLNQ